MTALDAAVRMAEAVDVLPGAGPVLICAVALAVVAAGIGTLCAGIAAIRLADAWKIWAGRCDPMNPNFQPPNRRGKR